MNKNNIVIGLSSITTIIGAWFFMTEYNYATNDAICSRSYKPCLAETLQWVGIAQIFAGLAIVYIGLILKENKGTN
jgi:hypothetical protein